MAAGFKNANNELEAKIYSGTDVDLAFSWKSGRIKFEHKETGLTGNVSQHYRLGDWTDFNSFNVVNVAEFDSVPTTLNTYKFRGATYKSTLTSGLRVNTETFDTRASFNFKYELPKGLRPFGWTPSVGVEIRK